MAFSSAPNGEGNFGKVGEGGQDRRPETHRGESGRGLIRDNSGQKGEKHYNKYNAIKPACLVEDAVMCIIQVHQMLVYRESVGVSDMVLKFTN